jgi:hypothetical protein
MTVVEAHYRRIVGSTTRALSEIRLSVGLLFCLVFNVLIITGVALICISGYGFARGISVVVLALAPTLMLLDIGLFARVELFDRVENEQQRGLLRGVSTDGKNLPRGQTLDQKNPSIVPEMSETAGTPSDAIDPISVPQKIEAGDNADAAARKETGNADAVVRGVLGE